jgi:hypothetical protein
VGCFSASRPSTMVLPLLKPVLRASAKSQQELELWWTFAAAWWWAEPEH